MKRSFQQPEPCKRRALQPVNTQLASPPTTPDKQRVLDLPTKSDSTRRKLFSSESVYSKAKALFQRGALNNGSVLVGREKEAEAFSSFITGSIAHNKCSSLYISGPPGTGKTAQVNLTLDTLIKQDTITAGGKTARVLRINCMAVSKAENIFHEILCELVGRQQSKKRTFDDFYAYLCSQQPTNSVLILLDEMDCLITKDQQVLFQLFQCALDLKTSALQTKLVLVGISNALDLTDKFLPRLRINGYTPEPLQFLPYTGEQVRQVIIAKLQSLDEDKENRAIPIMHPVAIQLCCKKCAAVTGDLRKAFDICYKSIDHVEQHVRKQDLANLTPHTAPKVLIGHVATVCASAFGDLSLAKLLKINFFQKVVLCCLTSMTAGCNVTPSVNQLYDYYVKHLSDVAAEMMGRLKKGEFLEIVSALESASVVVLLGNSDTGNKAVKPSVLPSDVLKAVDLVPILKKLVLN